MTANVVPIPATIAISDDLWASQTLVSVFPRRVDRPSRTFATPAEAETYAANLAKETGWEVFDARGRPPEAA